MIVLQLLWIGFCLQNPQNGFADQSMGNDLIVRVGAYDNYPKVYLDDGGRVVGLFPEILESIAMDAGWTIDYVPCDWVECLKKLENARIDIMVDVAYSEKRAERFAFNRESILVNWGIVYTQKGVAVESFLDLEGRRIAVMKGSIHTDGENGIKRLLEQFNIDAQLVEVENYTRVFEMLERQQVDAGVVNRIFGSLFAADYDLKRSPILFNPSQLRFAFPRQSPINDKLIETIDRSLKRLKSQQDSVYHLAVDAYLSGQPERMMKGAVITGGEPDIYLTDKEKAWIEAHPDIRLGIDPEFIPFEYINEAGEYSGIASDYIALLNQRLGIEMTIQKGLSWKQAVEKARRKEIDVLPCVGKTRERLEYLNYSRPYIQFQRVIITRSDFPFITGLENINPGKVAVQRYSSHYGYLLEKTDVNPRIFDTLQDAILSVSNGETDAFVGNAASSTYWIRQLNLTNLRVDATIPPEDLNLYFAVRSDWPELVSIINKGLRSVSQQERKRIYQKWVAIEYREGIDPELVWTYILRVACVVLLILGAILIWNRFLKKEIERRRAAEAQLTYFNQLEHLVSETSSRFVSLSEEEIDDTIHATLGAVAAFIGVDLAGIFAISREQHRVVCTHHWLSADLSAAFINQFETDLNKLPWWFSQLKQHQVFTLSDVTGLPSEATNLRAFIGETGVRSFVDIAQSYQGEMIGFLRFGSMAEHRGWKEEEISLLTLISQIITNAMQRDRAEQELVEYAAELQSANLRLQELDRLKSMFIASMSHELRTPLNSIIGFTGIILKGLTGEINEQQKDQLQRVYQSGKHLLNLITDVIDISKIEAGRIDSYPETFRVSEVVEEAIHAVSNQAQAKDLQLVQTIVDDVEMVQDKRRFLQCILNILSNGVKYTEEGSVSLIAQQREEEIEILVQDTGIGIAAEDLKRLFEPFERLDSHLRIKAGGTGLGLYLTRKIVREILQGDIMIKSEVGMGSTFGLRIPLRSSAIQDSTHAEPVEVT